MHYVLDENNNKIEGLSKEDIIALLNQAIADGTLDNIVAAAGISKVKCCVSGSIYKLAFVTQAKYNELAATGTLVSNCYYFVIDDTTAQDLEAKLQEIIATIAEQSTKHEQLVAAINAKKLYQHDITITNVESTYSIVITLRYLGKTETPITASNIIYMLGGLKNTSASGYLKIVANGNCYPVYKVESLENISSATTQFKVYFPANTDNVNGYALVSKDNITVTDQVTALI